MNRSMLPLLLCCAFFYAHRLPAQIILTSNFNTGSTNTDTPISVTANSWKGVSFRSGPDPVTLQWIDIQVQNNPVANTGSPFELSLYADNGGVPDGSPLTNLVGNTMPTHIDRYIAVGGFALQANTTYWVVASVRPGTGEYFWRVTSDTSSIGTDIGDHYFQSGDQGASWVTAVANLSPWITVYVDPPSDPSISGILTSNLYQLPSSECGSHFVDPSQWTGTSFTTDNQLYTLRSIQLWVNCGNSSSAFLLTIYSDDGGLPGDFIT